MSNIFCDEIFQKKYSLLKEDRQSSFKRVADTLGRNDKERCSFLAIMRDGCIPGGRIMANCGAKELKSGTSTINCTVSREIEDSIDGIMTALHEAALTLHSGAGIGYCFSSIRPAGAPVAGVNATTSGVIPFMKIFDTMCATISSSGGRRGAQMATMHVWHPDIEAFVDAKKQDGVLRHMNLSVLVTDEFMTAVQNDEDWHLWFPLQKNHDVSVDVGLKPSSMFPFCQTKIMKAYSGLIVVRIYKTIKARSLWDKIMQSTYDASEPGVIFNDTINKANPLNDYENINTTNPCGEIPLPEYGACLLGSINLTKYITPEGAFPAVRYEKILDDVLFNTNEIIDWRRFQRNVGIFADLLNSVVEHNNLPLPQQKAAILDKRRYGMGITGYGSLLNILSIKYGSDAALAVLRKFLTIMQQENYNKSLQGTPAPYFDTQEKIDSYYRNSNVSSVVSQKNFKGVRNTHQMAIAPTGTISVAFCGNCSSGIEPTFAHEYIRNVLPEQGGVPVSQVVYSYEWMLFQSKFPNVEMPSSFSTTENVTIQDHLRTQGVAQEYCDNSISKTINVPSDIPFEDFKDVYLEAYRIGCKGVTTYRYNPEVSQGVLLRKEDLNGTSYSFVLSDGSEVVRTGSEEVEYQGKIAMAGTLFNALKEGTWNE